MTDDTRPPFVMHYKHLGDFIGIAVELDGVLIWQKAFDADELDDLIQTLGNLRSGLPQIVTPELDQNARVETIPRPPVVMREQGEKGFELIFRHPGYGWLSFLLADHARKTIGEALLQGRRP